MPISWACHASRCLFKHRSHRHDWASTQTIADHKYICSVDVFVQSLTAPVHGHSREEAGLPVTGWLGPTNHTSEWICVEMEKSRWQMEYCYCLQACPSSAQPLLLQKTCRCPGITLQIKCHAGKAPQCASFQLLRSISPVQNSSLLLPRRPSQWPRCKCW